MEVCSQFLVRGSRCGPAHFQKLHGSSECCNIMATRQIDWTSLGANLQRGKAKPYAAAAKREKTTKF